MTKILVIEDHANLRESLRTHLAGEGFATDVAATIAEARAKILEKPDLIVLDWMLPDGQGIDLLKELRKSDAKTPVIFLTARAELFDKVLSLELGASDYMTKPFESRELVARIRARLRESGAANPECAEIAGTHAQSSTIMVGSLTIDRIKRHVRFREANVELVKKEFDLLALFAENPEKVFSRDELLNKVWGYDVYPTTRTVDTHVMLLRQKTDDRLIETVRAVGYRFKPL